MYDGDDKHAVGLGLANGQIVALHEDAGRGASFRAGGSDERLLGRQIGDVHDALDELVGRAHVVGGDIGPNLEQVVFGARRKLDCVSAPKFDPYRRPTMTPADDRFVTLDQNATGAVVGSTLEADWGSNAAPITPQIALARFDASGTIVMRDVEFRRGGDMVATGSTKQDP